MFVYLKLFFKKLIADKDKSILPKAQIIFNTRDTLQNVSIKLDDLLVCAILLLL